MKKVKKVISYIFYSFLALLVSLCVYTFISVDILGKDYANVFGYTYFVVASGSMSGSIEVDNIVVVKLNDKYETNDIITYKDDNGEFITHRYLKKVGNKLITKGDVNNTEDDPITPEQVIGKVKFVISPSFIFKLLAIIIILVIVIILFNFESFFKKISKKDDDIEDKIKDKKNKKVKTVKVVSPSSSGDTIKIPIGEITKLQSDDSLEVEILEVDYELDRRNAKEKKLLIQTVKLLKYKNDFLTDSKINKDWLKKYRYIYKLASVISVEDKTELESMIKKSEIKELYDYDMEEAGLYENLLNKIDDMPIYVFLQILVFSILYNDMEFFDGIYKMLKYKIKIDKQGEFTRVGKNDSLNKKKIDELLIFMRTISTKFDTKNVLQLEKITEFVKLKKYINE